MIPHIAHTANQHAKKVAADAAAAKKIAGVVPSIVGTGVSVLIHNSPLGTAAKLGMTAVMNKYPAAVTELAVGVAMPLCALAIPPVAVPILLVCMLGPLLTGKGKGTTAK
jgi:hypothetical protein